MTPQERYARNREQILARNREWYWANKAKRNASQKRYRNEHADELNRKRVALNWSTAERLERRRRYQREWMRRTHGYMQPRPCAAQPCSGVVVNTPTQRMKFCDECAWTFKTRFRDRKYRPQKRKAA